MTVSFCGKLQTNVGETTNRGSNAASDTVRRYQNTCWPLTLSWTKLQPVLFHYVCQKHLATFVSQWFVSQWFGQQTLSQQMVRIRMISKFYDGHLGEVIGSSPSKQRIQHHLQIIGGVRQDVFWIHRSCSTLQLAWRNSYGNHKKKRIAT